MTLVTSEPVTEMWLGFLYLRTPHFTLKLRTPKINGPLISICWRHDFREDTRDCALGPPRGPSDNISGHTVCNTRHPSLKHRWVQQIGPHFCKWVDVWHSTDRLVTKSQNVRGWKGPLWVTQPNPPAKAGSPRAGCTGSCPGGSWISPEEETQRWIEDEWSCYPTTVFKFIWLCLRRGSHRGIRGVLYIGLITIMSFFHLALADIPA